VTRVSKLDTFKLIPTNLLVEITLKYGVFISYSTCLNCEAPWS